MTQANLPEILPPREENTVDEEITYSIDHEQLPAIADAKLPASYEAAKTALATCSSIDECQDWADKAAALASYAKQAEDDELENTARRIRARAIRRCGELLREIEPRQGARTDIEPQETTLPRLMEEPPAAPPPVTRAQVATDAGLSEHQRKTALRVAAIPKEEFEEAVEARQAPLITHLAERGTVPRPTPVRATSPPPPPAPLPSPPPPPLSHLQGRDPKDFQAATVLMGIFRHVTLEAPSIDLHAARRGLAPFERQGLRQKFSEHSAWLEKVKNIILGES
jgi:hypothetical protein